MKSVNIFAKIKLHNTLFLLTLFCGSIAFWGYHNFSVQRDSFFEKTSPLNSLVVEFFRNEQIQLLSVLRVMAIEDEVIDMADFGRGRLLMTHFSKKLGKREKTKLVFYDFQGDFLASRNHQIPPRGRLNEKSVSLALEGKSTWRYQTEGDQVILRLFVPIGKKENPSGVLSVTREVGSQLIEHLESILGINADLIVEGKAPANILNKFPIDFLGSIPTNINRLKSKSTLFSSFGYLGKAVALELNVEPTKRTALLVGKKTSLLSISGNWWYLPAALLLANGMIMVILSLGSAGIIERHRKELIGLKENLESIDVESATTHPVTAQTSSQVLSALRQEFNELISKFQAQIESSKRKTSDARRRWQKLVNLVKVKDTTFKMFYDRMHALDEKRNSFIEDLKSEDVEDWKRGVEGVARFAATFKTDSAVLSLDHVNEKATSLSRMIQPMLNRDTVSRDGRIEEIQKIVQEVHNNFVAACELRKEVFGRDVRDVIVTPVSAMQVHWLFTLAARSLHMIRRSEISEQEIIGLETEFQHAITSIGKTNIQDYVALYNNLAVSLAKEHGNEVGLINISGNHKFIDKSHITKINDIIIQSLRNSIRHGIESPIARKDMGKPKFGTIDITVNTVGEWIDVVVEDDGRGVDLDLVKERAASLELIGASQAKELSEEKLVALLFEPGFHLPDPRTNKGSLGLGLTAVKKMIEESEGEVHLITSKGRGSILKASLPNRLEEVSAHQSLLDLRALLQSLVNKTELTNCEIKVNEGATLVYADDASFRKGFCKVLEAYQTALEDDDTIEFDVSEDSQLEDHFSSKVLGISIKAHRGGELVPLTQVISQQSFREGMQTFVGASGLHLQLKPTENLVQIGVLVNHELFSHSSLLEINWLVSEAFEDQLKTVESYFSTQFPSIQVNINQDLDFLGSNVSTTQLTIVDRATAYSMMLTGASSIKGPVLLIADSTPQFPNEVLKLLESPPLIVESCIDESALSKLVEQIV